jgi:hypothetical protein
MTMPIVLCWLRLDLQRRWRSVAVFALPAQAIPVALVVANLLAARPGRRAAGPRIAQILRTE